jgi:(p)ppGpp synthase/HD superfamily hydrolase
MNKNYFEGPLASQAYKLAKAAHTGQTRWNGDDYFETHCVGVAKIAIGDFDDAPSILGDGDADRRDFTIALALLHDTMEDTDISIADILAINVRLAKAVLSLTKMDGETYLAYIVRLMDSHTEFSFLDYCSTIYVKLCDLKHNMSDLKNGSRKDKYEMAAYMLAIKMIEVMDNEFKRLRA